MILSTLPSGVAAIVDDVRQALAAVQFDRPRLLVLVLAPLVLLLIGRLHSRQQRLTLSRLGRQQSLTNHNGATASRSRLAAAPLVLAWVMLVVAAAGPKWGKGDDGGVAIGRDVILVIDLSRSMLAQDLTEGNVARWQSATSAALDLVHAAETSGGGHRIGIVIFAARPRLLVPLTTDLAHVRAIISSLDGENLPDAIRPADDQAGSGTRMGAALRLAVDAQDFRYPGSQDIVLLTDGDDPLADNEWSSGVTAARQANIPIHVVGIGDPNTESLIRVRGVEIERPLPGGARTPVLTSLKEHVARAIAEESRGSYIPARRDPAQLGDFFRTHIKPKPVRESTDDATPQPVSRAVWFYSAALGLLAARYSIGLLTRR